MAHLEEGGQKSGKKVYSLQLQQRYQWTTVIKKSTSIKIFGKATGNEHFCHVNDDNKIIGWE